MNELNISFITVCRNRLYHLNETLIKNIEDNRQYTNLEFVLLDYNSSDGLEQFVKDNLYSHIESGRLVYYKTSEPKYFRRGHSRNLGFKLATGEILCNVDADNYTGLNFASYINSMFSRHENIFLCSTASSNDVLGRICITRENFLRLTGFDEKMDGYGFEDFDLINRLCLLGLEKKQIEDNSFLKAISHTDRERISEERFINKISNILVHYVNYYSSELLFLFDDNTYEKFSICYDHIKKSCQYFSEMDYPRAEYEFSLLEDNWEKGNWKLYNNLIELVRNNGLRTILNLGDDGAYINMGLNKSDHRYFLIYQTDMIDEAAFFHSQVTNRIIMKENLKHERIVANENGFGFGRVTKNFKFICDNTIN